MTLALAVFNDAGAVLAADGLSSYGIVAGAAQQVPYNKLHLLGDRCACAEVGDLSKSRALADALMGSPLATESTLSRTGAEWLEVARAAIKAWTSLYLANSSFVAGLHLNQQFQEADLLLAGCASDGSFAYAISWLGEYGQPDAAHYKAIGSGAVSARIYLDAYSYFGVAAHPVLTLEALAARVMEKVAHNNMEVGGEIRLIAIHRETSEEHPDPSEEMSAQDPKVRGAIEHWQLAEDVVDKTLLMFSNPDAEVSALTDPTK